MAVAAIIFLDTVYMKRTIEALRAAGECVPDEILAHLAPIGWQHINLIGDSLWSAKHGSIMTSYRPLRAPTELMAA